MRISSLRTTPLTLPARTHRSPGDGGVIYCLLADLESDDGVTGSSFAFAFQPGHLRVIDAIVRELAELVIGEDARFSGRISAACRDGLRFLGHEGAAIVGLSVIERAMWDLRARTLGVPIAHLLGATRETVPVYISGLWLTQDIDDLVWEAGAHVDAGYRAIKMRVGLPDTARDLERVAAVRQAVGPGIALMVDANKRLDRVRALQLGRGLERYDVGWFEEPIDSHDVPGYAALAAALDVPIAAGESEFTSGRFRELASARAADVLMPDLGRVGGYREMLRVADIARAEHLVLTPHHYPHENLQMLAALDNGTYLEHVPWFDALFQERVEVRDGLAAVPSRPGNGFTVDRQLVAARRIA